MISSPSGSPKTVVFRRQISSPNFKGFPLTGASNKSRSEKFSDFLAISVNISPSTDLSHVIPQTVKSFDPEIFEADLLASALCDEQQWSALDGDDLVKL